LDNTVGADKFGIYYQGSIEFDSLVADSLTFAFDYEEESFKQRGAATLFGDPNQNQRLRTTGYVIEYRLTPVNALSLSAAARRDKSSAFDSATTYRLTAAYPFDDDRTRLRASVGTGQKSPTFIERFGFFADAFVGNPGLAPETSKGWEIGIDRTFLDERLVFGATYFDERLRNEINGFVFDLDTFQFTAANEIGKSFRKGVEITVTARPTQKLRLTASGTFLESTQDDGLGQQLVEIRRPEQMAALNISYAASERANVSLNLAYNGAQYDTFFPPFPQSSQRVELASYKLITLAASYRLTDRVELFGRIENMLDEDYEDVFGFATPGVATYVGLRTRR
jgi:vitamin B12 transporter